MAKRTDKPPRHTGSKGERSNQKPDGHAPTRLDRALYLLTPRRDGDKVIPGCSYVEAQEALAREFGIHKSTAADDLRRAYDVVRDRIAATDYPSVIRSEMETIARGAAANGDNATASITWYRLGRFAGMEESEDSLVKKLSDAALEAAIKQAVAEKIEGMSEAEFADLQQRRAAKAGGQ
jgi:hypothetical protein